MVQGKVLDMLMKALGALLHVDHGERFAVAQRDRDRFHGYVARGTEARHGKAQPDFPALCHLHTLDTYRILPRLALDVAEFPFPMMAEGNIVCAVANSPSQLGETSCFIW